MAMTAPWNANVGWVCFSICTELIRRENLNAKAREETSGEQRDAERCSLSIIASHGFIEQYAACSMMQPDNVAILAEAFPTSRHAWRQIFLLLLGTWMALCGGSLYAFSRWLEVIPFASIWMQSTPMQCNFFMLYIWYIVWNLVSSGCSSSWQVRGANHEPLQPLCATFGCHICSWPGA